ncbi:hypothetical protein F2Q70_00015242 [Brassica cretica]|uniref:Uncharacterized protein n=1 Tax=Brassica cretica TaxID=69181 RepID=A0A8S9I0B0_BRACR|nr:hypothetical protein F2Q70_00015242 [Brassica cretica]
MDELSRTDTHLDKLSKHVRSFELVRPPEKLKMANILSDEPMTNSIMPKNLSCFLVSHIQVNTSSNRWTCASYQATTRDPSLGGLVSHIKHHLESGISEAFRNLRATVQSIQFSIRSSYPNRTSRNLEWKLVCVITTNSERNTCVGEDQTLECVRRTNRSEEEIGEKEFHEGDSKSLKKSTTTCAPVAEQPIFVSEKPNGKSENTLEELKDFSDSLPILDEYDEDLIESLIICGDKCDRSLPGSDYFEEKKAPSITPIIMENQLCFDPGTTSTPFPINFQEHFKFLKHNQAVQTGYLGDASDRGSVQGEYLNIQKVLFPEFNFPRRPTQQGFTKAWNYKKLFTEEKVMNFTNRKFHSPSICEYQTFEGDSSPMKKRPETKPIIGFKMDLPYFQKA